MSCPTSRSPSRPPPGEVHATPAVDLRFEHRIPRTVAAVEASLLDRAFASALASACPALVEARVLDYVVGADATERVTWFRARPECLGAALAWLPRVAWTERVRWSRTAHAGSVAVSPDLPAALARCVRCDGSYALLALHDGVTLRRVEITLAIRAPWVGGAAEARLATMLRSLFDAEASLLARGVE